MGLAKLKPETLSTPKDYLTFEREANTRHEFLDGEVYDRVEFEMNFEDTESYTEKLGFKRTGETDESGEIIMRFKSTDNGQPTTNN